MPLYDYDCAACGRRFEVVHGLHAPAPEACPLCGGGPVRKAFAPPAIHFKGSGWAKKERRATAAPSSTGAASSDGSGDGTDSGSGTSSSEGVAPSSDGAPGAAKDTASTPASSAGD